MAQHFISLIYTWYCMLVCIRIRSISPSEKRIAEAPQLCDTSIYEGLRPYSRQIERQYRFSTPSRRWLLRPLLPVCRLERSRLQEKWLFVAVAAVLRKNVTLEEKSAHFRELRVVREQRHVRLAHLGAHSFPRMLLMSRLPCRIRIMCMASASRA